jgi:hypothetical protein
MGDFGQELAARGRAPGDFVAQIIDEWIATHPTDASIDTDVTMAADSDVRVPSQRAVAAYVAAHAGGGGDSEWTVVGSGGGSPDYVLGFQGEIEAGGSAFRDLSFRKDALGFVHLEGACNGSGTDVFVLPTGYRPAAQIWDAVSDSGGGLHRCDVKADGTVTFPDSLIGAAVCLGFSFYADGE